MEGANVITNYQEVGAETRLDGVEAQMGSYKVDSIDASSRMDSEKWKWGDSCRGAKGKG